LRPFLDSDLAEIQSWMKARNLTTKQKPSTIGVIEPGVACCFLYITDSNWAIMDMMISNPASDPKIRDEALFRIGESLCALAKEIGFELISWVTERDTMVKRGTQAGYQTKAVTFFTKEL